MAMKKKYILPFLFVGLVFSFGVAMLNGQKKVEQQPALAAHHWGNLTRLDEMKALLRGFNIKTLVDTSCQEAGLIQKFDLGIENYIGVDRRSEVVDAMRCSIGSAQRVFIAQDITRDPLPNADLILCWDDLQSLPTMQIHSAISLFKKSGAKYLLVSHFPDLKKNHKSRSGEYRPINWTLPPYRFPEPMIQISEQKENGQPKSLALWKVSELP